MGIGPPWGDAGNNCLINAVQSIGCSVRSIPLAVATPEPMLTVRSDGRLFKTEVTHEC